MRPAQIGAIIEQVNSLWGLGDIEIALEANPHEMNALDWRGYSEVGLNRMSLGAQSFHDEALKFLGRDHDVAAARAALDLAMEIFPSVSADLIFGWAGQTNEMLDSDLQTLLAAQVPHISTYQLTIEEGTAFAKAEGRGQSRAVDSDLSADFYDHVRQTLGASGFDHYEVSNFAQRGHRSKHNLAYWRGLDYAGVGPGAHGRMTKDGRRQATIAHLRPSAYTRAVTEGGSGIDRLETLSGADWAAEYLLMGLRIDEGISKSRYADLAGEPLVGGTLNTLIRDGFLIEERDKLKATTEGRLVLNAVTEALLLT